MPFLVARSVVPLLLALVMTGSAALGSAAVAADGPELRVAGAPLDGAGVPAGSTVTLLAPPAAASVTWVLDGSYLGKDSTPPFELALLASPGAHELTARVDGATGERLRAEAEFRVTADQGLLPARAPAPRPVPTMPAPAPAPPAAPAQPGTLSVGGVALAGSVTAAGFTVDLLQPGATKVKWYVDRRYVGVDSSAPFRHTLTLSTGTHTLQARAEDASGGSTRVTAEFRVGGSGAPAPTPAPAPTGPTTSPVPVPVPAPGPATVRVRNGPELAAALAAARPGTHITLADGAYTGKSPFTVSTACTAQAPCSLSGGRGAVLDGGSVTGHYGLHLVGASHWTVSGFTVTRASKGVVLDRSSRNRLDALEVHTIGDEAIHLRARSSDNVVSDNLVHDTGKHARKYGEGIYIGSAVSNWGTYSDGLPDTSDRNVVRGNRIWATGAESVDIKEGTTGGVLSGNTFDGAGMSGENFADSWVDVKGNNWLVEGNTGVNALLDGFQTHVQLAGWGQGTVFRGNTARVGSGGYGFRVHQPATSRTVVSCTNVVNGAGSGTANQPCT